MARRTREGGGDWFGGGSVDGLRALLLSHKVNPQSFVFRVCAVMAAFKEASPFWSPHTLPVNSGH